MGLLVTHILFLITSIVGALVCIIGFKKNEFFKGGFIMFLLFSIAGISQIVNSALSNTIIRLLMRQGVVRISFWIQFMQIPPYILLIMGSIIFIVFLLRAQMKKNNT